MSRFFSFSVFYNSQALQTTLYSFLFPNPVAENDWDAGRVKKTVASYPGSFTTPGKNVSNVLATVVTNAPLPLKAFSKQTDR